MVRHAMRHPRRRPDHAARPGTLGFFAQAEFALALYHKVELVLVRVLVRAMSLSGLKAIQPQQQPRTLGIAWP